MSSTKRISMSVNDSQNVKKQKITDAPVKKCNVIVYHNEEVCKTPIKNKTQNNHDDLFANDVDVYTRLSMFNNINSPVFERVDVVTNTDFDNISEISMIGNIDIFEFDFDEVFEY